MLSIQFDKIKKVNNNYYKIYNDDYNSIYIGEYVNGKINGYGKYFNDNISYHGNWKNNLFDGNGYLEYLNKNDNNIKKYIGIFTNGLKNIKGIEYYEKNYYYIGEFKNDKKNGKGILYKNYNIIFKGEWFEDQPINTNEYKYMMNNNNNISIKYNNISINCNINITFNNNIISYYSNNNIKFDGGVSNSIYNGFGKYYKLDDDDLYWLLYEGTFLDGLYHGNGKLYNSDNSVFYCGIFFKGEIAEENVEIKCKNLMECWNYKGIININKNYSTISTNLLTNYNYPIIYFLQGEKKDYKKKKIIIGKWKNNELNGENLIMDIKYNKIFCGIIINNKYTEGNEYYSNGNIKFCGKYIYDERNKGFKIYEGKFYNNDNSEYKEGIISKSLHLHSDVYFNYKLNGEGKILKKINNKWRNYKLGIFLGNNLHGKGKIFENGCLKFEGYFYNNLLEGYGMEFNNKGFKIYEGQFFNNYKHGEGTIYNDDGDLIYNTTFIYGQIKN